MEAMKKFGQSLLLLFVSAGTIVTFAVPSAQKFQVPDLARMVFWHLPCALVSAALVCIAPYFGFQALRADHKDDKRVSALWDIRMTAAMELALLTGILTLITGMLFSKTQWGAWWNWDPRQSSYLMVMLMIGAFFAIRASMDPERRGPYSASYLMAAVLPLLFLVFVYPKLPAVKSLHPNVIQEGSFDPTYRYTFYSMFVLIALVVAWAYRLRTQLGFLELQTQQRNAELADRNHSAAPRMVRPIPVSQPGEPTA
jgi:heme exporter protein C